MRIVIFIIDLLIIVGTVVALLSAYRQGRIDEEKKKGGEKDVK